MDLLRQLQSKHNLGQLQWLIEIWFQLQKRVREKH